MSLAEAGWRRHCTDAAAVDEGPLSRLRAWSRAHRTDLHPASLLSLWWCAALLAHYDDRAHWGISGVTAASVAAALLGMFLSRSSAVLASVAVLQLAAMWSLFPGVDNHWAFAGFVDLALLLATVLWAARKRARGQPIGVLDDDWYALVAPTVRLLVIVMYAFAVFHKLNVGFLDVADSCAVSFYRRMTTTPLVPLWPHPIDQAHASAIIAAVLTVEAGIPILLAGRRTWFLGIALGVCFHLSTGLFMRHYPSIMMALYWVFVPTEVQRRWVATVEAWLCRATRGWIGYIGAVRSHSVALFAASVLAEAIVAQRGISITHPDSPGWWVLRGWNVFVAAGALVAGMAFLRCRGVVAHPPGRFRPPLRWLYAVPVLFGLNCLSPYLGLKTVTSINMWSNLVVTGEDTNHLFLSADAIRIFDYTRDVVRVKSGDDKELRAWAGNRSLVAWSVFRQAVQRAVARARKDGRTVRVVYQRAGVEYAVGDAARDEALMERAPYLERKLVKIKPVPAIRPARCTL
jgi:hypothetical protein